MLKDSLYTIIERPTSADDLRYVVRLNPDHVIYKAHFPQCPITPGVCIVQMVQELAEDYLSCTLQLKEGKSIKFLNLLVPDKDCMVQVVFYNLKHEEGRVTIQCVVTKGETSIAKLNFVSVENE